MLQSLTLQNFALLPNVQISLGEGMHVFTGTTGSGKSMLLKALSLMFGARWTDKMFFDETKNCILEAEYELSDPKSFNSWCVEQGIDSFSSRILLRREHLPSKRQRCFVNDQLVSLAQLHDLGTKLHLLFHQNEHQNLRESAEQLTMIDGFCTAKNFEQRRREYSLCYTEYLSAKKALKEVENAAQHREETLQTLDFQISELSVHDWEKYTLSEIEDQIRDVEYEEQRNAFLTSVVNYFEQDGTVLSYLSRWKKELLVFSNTSPKYETWLQKIDEIETHLKDLQQEIATEDLSQEESLDIDTLQQILFDFQRLSVKYGLEKQQDLLLLLQEKQQEKVQLHSIDEALLQAKTRLKDTLQQLSVSADALHDLRKTASKRLSESVKCILPSLAMPNAQFEVSCTQSDSYSVHGNSEIEFLFSSHTSLDLKTLKEAGSGGEIARLNLAILSVSAPEGRCIILDEIDTGVSGEVAIRMGELMHQMGKNTQVICVSHLAQVASKANKHFKVAKHDEVKTKPEVHISELDYNQRIEEIAGLLSGSSVLASARETAKILLSEQ